MSYYSRGYSNQKAVLHESNPVGKLQEIVIGPDVEGFYIILQFVPEPCIIETRQNRENSFTNCDYNRIFSIFANQYRKNIELWETL